jgi:hypothetical protein
MHGAERSGILRLRRRSIAVGVAVTALALTAGPISPASADYPVAYNEKTQVLSTDPNSDMAWSVAARDIDLTAGCYWWRLWFAGSPVQDGAKNIYLASDHYLWEDTLEPYDGVYGQWSYLQGDHYPDGASNPYSSPPGYERRWDVASGGAPTTWGSSLKWLHAGYC